MASSKVLAVIHIISLLLPTTLSQTVGNSPPDPPSIAECGPYLLPLAPCGPFVQGTVPFPALQCCINLRQLYAQQPSCLCLLINGSTLSDFPINTTLALQLPSLCTMQIDASICSAPRVTTQPPSQPPSPFAPTSSGPKHNSTIAASPVVTVQPRMPGLIGFGYPHSSGVNINVKDSLMVVILTSWCSMFWV
ncbi:PREDICTED: protein YLS3 [Ipomoea nil]|uniref:protein YLS3 n=1 Tax=Ipomoea nil TaxID=35883 RepID=UPI000901AD63|nr:PREDICTED: protein YLS3 [Ipomoea nil]